MIIMKNNKNHCHLYYKKTIILPQLENRFIDQKRKRNNNMIQIVHRILILLMTKLNLKIPEKNKNYKNRLKRAITQIIQIIMKRLII